MVSPKPGAPILLAGPTASGKTALAVALAQETGAVVVNADSMQVYADWRVLTARPTPEEEAAAPHRLYGHVALDAAYSVGSWLAEVQAALAEGAPAVIVGGTGLYFEALTKGLAQIPPIPPTIRAEGEALLAARGAEGLHALVEAESPRAAEIKDPRNPVRVLRAWEVWRATGRALADWAAEQGAPLVPLESARPLVLDPPREKLYDRCDARFDQMLRQGALEEARAVLAADPPPDAPGLKAIGAPELLAYLRGDCALEEAAEAAKTATRHYAKRQLSWFRNRMRGWPRATLEEYCDPAAFARNFLHQAD